MYANMPVDGNNQYDRDKASDTTNGTGEDDSDRDIPRLYSRGSSI